ncbi:MAG: hypothetical protein OJI67_10955, partial [Prosthecobacter sp.]|nr:hypothetical protein [Prosthecobacter sp.]
AGETSLSLGQDTGAYTDRSIAIGRGSLAYLPGQVAIGNYNILGNVVHTVWQYDPIFIIGNGTADNARSNALVVKRNGDMEVKGSSLTVNGNQVLTEVSGDTRYLKAMSDPFIFVYGEQAEATAWTQSFAIGYHAKAGANAISIGGHAGDMGSGIQSVALGYVARALGNSAVALGYEAYAGGADSLAILNGSATRTDRTIAIGKGVEATRPGQVALGNYNLFDYTSHTPSPGDQIFVIGNGTADNARSNALVVRRNGDMEVKGTSLTVNGEVVLTEAALDAAIETVNLGGGNYISKNPLIGLTYGTNSTAAAHSVALGEESVASGTLSSSAMGYFTLANQSGTHALGNYLVANRPGQIVLGNYNDFGLDSAGSATADPADAIFVIGNGSADNARSNALVIKRGGDIALQGTSLTYNGAGLLTQASADTLYLSQTQATANYLTVAAATAAYQTKPAVGIDFLTSEDLVTIQASIEAKIDESELEAALENIDLSGNYLSSDPQVGLAYGTGSSAVAASSSAIGEHVEANMTGQVVVGRYNKVETASNPPTEDDPVFVVGVGNGIPEDEGERKNAVVVKRNGDVNVTGGVLRVMPAGDLSMDGFTSGPTPIDLE